VESVPDDAVAAHLAAAARRSPRGRRSGQVSGFHPDQLLRHRQRFAEEQPDRLSFEGSRRARVCHRARERLAVDHGAHRPAATRRYRPRHEHAASVGRRPVRRDVGAGSDRAAELRSRRRGDGRGHAGRARLSVERRTVSGLDGDVSRSGLRALQLQAHRSRRRSVLAARPIGRRASRPDGSLADRRRAGRAFLSVAVARRLEQPARLPRLPVPRPRSDAARRRVSLADPAPCRRRAVLRRRRRRARGERAFAASAHGLRRRRPPALGEAHAGPPGRRARPGRNARAPQFLRAAGVAESHRGSLRAVRRLPCGTA
jgi:hypothetical protein